MNNARSPPKPTDARPLPPPAAAGTKADERNEALVRYRHKKKNRHYEKTIRYEMRQLRASKRPRVKGRFARADDIGAVMPTELSTEEMHSTGRHQVRRRNDVELYLACRDARVLRLIGVLCCYPSKARALLDARTAAPYPAAEFIG